MFSSESATVMGFPRHVVDCRAAERLPNGNGDALLRQSLPGVGEDTAIGAHTGRRSFPCLNCTPC
jgi:hypothetical protein